jgi:hypothetical protein
MQSEEAKAPSPVVGCDRLDAGAVYHLARQKFAEREGVEFIYLNGFGAELK